MSAHKMTQHTTGNYIAILGHISQLKSACMLLRMCWLGSYVTPRDWSSCSTARFNHSTAL